MGLEKPCELPKVLELVISGYRSFAGVRYPNPATGAKVAQALEGSLEEFASRHSEK